MRGVCVCEREFAPEHMRWASWEREGKSKRIKQETKKSANRLAARQKVHDDGDGDDGWTDTILRHAMRSHDALVFAA